ASVAKEGRKERAVRSGDGRLGRRRSGRHRFSRQRGQPAANFSAEAGRKLRRDRGESGADPRFFAAMCSVGRPRRRWTARHRALENSRLVSSGRPRRLECLSEQGQIIEISVVTPIFMSGKHIFRFFFLTPGRRRAEYRGNSWEVKNSESIGFHSTRN